MSYYYDQIKKKRLKPLTHLFTFTLRWNITLYKDLNNHTYMNIGQKFTLKWKNSFTELNYGMEKFLFCGVENTFLHIYYFVVVENEIFL